MPGTAIDVSIDGRTVRDGVDAGAVLGPFELSPGRHAVRFTDASGAVAMSTSVTVGAGSSRDVVLHRPAAVGGDPVVNVYRTPRKPIGPGKARVVLAHTATVAPADVRVDGQVVFTNIANGEFAEADVPAGTHKVELLPSGQTGSPILGPLDVALKARTVTMVYAVGNPSNGSMDVIAHTATIAADGTVVPDTIDTGSAGLAHHVTPFGAGDPSGRGVPTGLLVGLVAALAGVLLAARTGLAGRVPLRAPRRGKR